MSFCHDCEIWKFVKIIENYLIKKPTIFVSGIGCAGRLSSIVKNKKQNIHTLHGRALPIAVGVSEFENVIVASGDGDLLDIGLSHLIHAKERNDNIKVFCLYNAVYAMTGRQLRAKKKIEEFLADSIINIYDKELDKKINEVLKADGFQFMIIKFPCKRM